MRQLIYLLSATKRNSVSSNSAFLKKALDFRADIGQQERTTTVGAILKAWETAYDYGAIGANHHLMGTATKGRYQGERLVFENIVPASALPECKGYLGNIRLVPESRVWKPGKPVDRRDVAYANGLRQVVREAANRTAMLNSQKSKVGELGFNKAEHEARWRKEVEATGKGYLQPPNLKIIGQRLSSPSKMNGNVYKVRVDITNMSRHPTEVEIESAIIAYTEENNRTYELRRDRRTLKLRRSEIDDYEIKSPNVGTLTKLLQDLDPRPLIKGKIQPQPIIYRGYTVVAKFNGKVIASTGSDGRMAKIASGEYAAPAVVTQATRAGSMAESTPLTILKTYNLMQFNTPADLASGKNGKKISAGLMNTVGLMSDGNRMYRLDFDGKLSIYESASFSARNKIMGRVFAGANVHSLFSDGTSYYMHISETAGKFKANDVVKFASITEMMTGDNGTVINQAAAGSATFLANKDSFYKISNNGQTPVVLGSQNLNQLVINGEHRTVGNLFCGKSHSGMFSDGKHYYIQVALE